MKNQDFKVIKIEKLEEPDAVYGFEIEFGFFEAESSLKSLSGRCL